MTNTFILGAFIVAAFKESWRNKHPRQRFGAELVEHSTTTIHAADQVIVPPACSSGPGPLEPRPTRSSRVTTVALGRVTPAREKEVAAT